MRVAILLSLHSFGLLGLLACNAPLPENEAPSIRLVTPEGDFNSDLGERLYFANALVPIDLEVLVRDRDGDEALTLTVYLDDTPENADDSSRTELFDFPEVTADVAVMFTMLGFEEGNQVLEMVAGDGAVVNPTRTARFAFQVEASISAPEIAITPTNPRTGDGLVGTLVTPAVDPEGGSTFHEWQWSDGTIFVPAAAPATGFPANLPAVNTVAGETWEFCVKAYRSPDGLIPFNDSIPIEICTETTIENTPPGAPGGVDLVPNLPTPADPLECQVTADASDADGDAVTYTYAWTRDGGAVAGQTSAWISPTLTEAGEVWACTATATDGVDAGGSASSQAPHPQISDVTIPVTAASRAVSGGSGAFFGDAVVSAPLDSVQGNDLIIGDSAATPFDGVGPDFGGQVLVFRGSAISTPQSTYEGYTDARLGEVLATGDLDGDGLDDVIAGANGAAWVLYSEGMVPSPQPLSSTSIDVIGITSLDPAFGAAVAIGDLNQGAPGGEVAVTVAAGGQLNEVLVFPGTVFDRGFPDIDDTDATTTITGPGTGDAFGGVLLAGSDVDADGSADLIITNRTEASGPAVMVFSGNIAGALDSSFAQFAVTTSSAAQVGASVAAADVNGDGIDDLIVGAPGSGPGGQVGIFFGGSGLPSTVPFSGADVMISGEAGSEFGAWLSVLPDPSGQFGANVVAGAPGEDIGAPDTNEGFVHIFTGEQIAGAATLTSSDSVVRYRGEAAGDALQTTGTSGDLDGDGFPDLVVASPSNSGGVGRVYVMYSSML